MVEEMKELRIDDIVTSVKDAIKEKADRIRRERGIPEIVDYEKNPELLDNALRVLERLQEHINGIEPVIHDMITAVIDLIVEYVVYSWITYCVKDRCEGGGAGYDIDIVLELLDMYRAFQRVQALLYEEIREQENRRKALQRYL